VAVLGLEAPRGERICVNFFVNVHSCFFVFFFQSHHVYWVGSMNVATLISVLLSQLVPYRQGRDVSFHSQAFTPKPLRTRKCIWYKNAR
jgi:hypothetical protein